MWHKLFVKYGLVAGTSTIALFLLFYLLAPQGMLHPAVWWGSLIIYISCMWIAGRRGRQSASTAPSFRQLMQFTFPVFVVANVVFYTFWYLLLQYDSQLVELQYEALRQGGWQGQMEDLAPRLGTFVWTLLQSFLGGAILSALLAWGLKEE